MTLARQRSTPAVGTGARGRGRAAAAMPRPGTPAQPTRGEALSRLVAGLLADEDDYRQLRALLEEQFTAALQHHSVRLTELAEQVVTAVERLHVRRRERMALAQRLLGDAVAPTMTALGRLLPAEARAEFDRRWQSLEELVRDCKRLNYRNCRLLMDQRDIMRRVLGQDADIYVPA